MNEELPRCNICGEYSTHTLGVSEALTLCDNIVCYHASIQLIEEALAAQGEV